MGRPKLKMDNNTILALRSEGKHIKDISRAVGVSGRTPLKAYCRTEIPKRCLDKIPGASGTATHGITIQDITSNNT